MNKTFAVKDDLETQPLYKCICDSIKWHIMDHGIVCANPACRRVWQLRGIPPVEEFVRVRGERLAGEVGTSMERLTRRTPLSDEERAEEGRKSDATLGVSGEAAPSSVEPFGLGMK